ncbi:LysR family transcriptional regulator [Burkholderia ambifaria]|uniref:LysR family transcriptional regulator n=1 Tax=Burkholderia ambifaria TaxID=152480 RepID=UPI000F7FF0BE|nr:LysR family transcriptional regulator [Burkholderia ambifaria]
MDTLQEMRWFLKVVETSSFTAAADFLGVSAGGVSRAVSNLERHLQARLLNRTTRKVSLTEAGYRYAQSCASILDQLDIAEAQARDARAKPSGRLRLHGFSGIGHHYVIPSVASYANAYPDVDIDLTLSTRMPDLVEEGLDAAIVLADSLPDSVLVAQKIGATASILCASPSFLQSHAPIQKPKDLEGLPCVEISNPLFPSGRWMLQTSHGDPIAFSFKSKFRCNAGESIAAALELGIGVGAVPAYSALRALHDGTLVRVLPKYYLHPINIFVLYASTRYLDAKIRTWIDHLKGYMPSLLDSERSLIDGGIN